MIAVAATSWVVATAFAQWSFRVDTTFRTDIVQRAVNSIVVLSNGELLLSGIMQFPSEFNDKRLVKLNDSGARNELFYNSGLGGGTLISWNDKVYVNAGIPRRILLPSGNNDPTFVVGNFSVPYFLYLQGGDFHVYPDGSVLISGEHLLSDSIRGFEGVYNLVWFTNTGYLDTTRTHRQANGVIWNFKELPNGKFLCSCGCSQYEGQPVSRVFRIHPNGALDTTFNSDITNGFLKTYFPLSDGRVMVGGNFQSSLYPGSTLHLARFLPSGNLDPTFETLQFAGNNDWWIPAGTSVFDIFQFTPDRFIVTGQFTTVNGEPRGGICMIDSAGQLMPEFDASGGGPFTYQNVTNLAILEVNWNQDSTAIYVCGAYTGYSDGTTNDPAQRFVSRLLVTEDDKAIEGLPPRDVCNFSLYPNPTSQTTTLALEQMLPNTTFVLHDALGCERLRQTIRNNYTTLDLQNLANGIYLVELWRNGGRMGTERLVVQH